MRSNSALVRATILAGSLAVVLLPSVNASPSDDGARRARVPNNVALRIAAKLFPEQCGAGHCGIKYGPEYCPFQFAVVFPTKGESTQPPGAWITVDPRGNVTEVSSLPSKECRKGDGFAS